jgi:hypothetical protein
MSQIDDHLTTSSRNQTKTPAHTLTRVRNNQRRHRQRRREYIVSLEQHLQETQALLAQAEAHIARLQAELDRRKDLNQATHRYLKQPACLESTLDGADNHSLLSLPEQQPRRADERPDATPSGVPQALPMTSQHMTTAETSLVASLTPSTARATVNAELSLDHPRRDFIPAQCCSPAEEQPAPPSFVSQDLVIPPSPCNQCDTYPRSDEKESTTLCSQAYVLIAQQNFRGLNAVTVKNWLDQGFRRAKVQDEGCRVENGLLFGLLDFISGA